MTLPSLYRLALALCGGMALAGCERTVFEHPPAADEACDPALVGTWLSEGDRPEEHGELTATVSADCRLSTVERRADGERRSTPTRLHVARVDGVRYLWLDAGWAHRSFDVEANALDHRGDVYLYAYHVARDRLRLAAPPIRAVAHRVLDKDIAGEVLLHDDSLTVRLTGTPEEIRRTLRRHRLFRLDEALDFRRAADGAR